MNTKTLTFLTANLFLATTLMLYSQADKAFVMQAIKEFKAQENSGMLMQCLSKIEREPSLTESSRAELLFQVLIASMQYLDDHPKPQGNPFLNIAPPDGSIPGADPASIKDPKMRAQYEKDIAANKSLAEAHTKHTEITSVRDKLIRYFVSFSNINSENKKLFSDSLKSNSSNPETIKAVVALMKIEEAKRTPKSD